MTNIHHKGFWYHLNFWYRGTKNYIVKTLNLFWYHLNFWYRGTVTSYRFRLLKFWYHLNFWYRGTGIQAGCNCPSFGIISIFGIEEPVSLYIPLSSDFGVIPIFGI